MHWNLLFCENISVGGKNYLWQKILLAKFFCEINLLAKILFGELVRRVLQVLPGSFWHAAFSTPLFSCLCKLRFVCSQLRRPAQDDVTEGRVARRACGAWRLPEGGRPALAGPSGNAAV